MASSKEFTEYVVDQLSGAGVIQYKKLFGEYGLWCGGMYLVEELEERDFLQELVLKTCEELPMQKPRKPKGNPKEPKDLMEF